MWRAAAVLALILCAGCGTSDFYQQKSQDWFSNQPPGATASDGGKVPAQH
jgi:hypothetical protein